MGGFTHPLIQYLILILSCNLSFHVLSTAAQSKLTPNRYLSNGETLVSPNGAFKLGFFIPTDSTYRYIAIWYNNIPIQTAIWVANRETPLKTNYGAVLALSSDGNLAIRNLTGGVAWSTNTSHMSNPVVELLNSGNLILTDGDYNESQSNSIVWQSFDYPSDTLLPGMKLGWDLRANRDRRITSWRSTSDPAPGPYSYGVDLQGVPELYIWNGSVPESRSGPWNGQSWSGIAPIDHSDLFSMQFISTSSEVYYTYKILNASVTSLMVLDQFGIGRILLWQSQQWQLYSQGPADLCGRYGRCGAFGVCNTGNLPNCRCMTGFDPKSQATWDLQNGTGGCVRRTPLNCSVAGENGFLKVSGVKLPETKKATVWNVSGLDQCSDWCSKNCSCKAYAFLSGASGCIAWLGDLVDTRDLTDSGGEDLYVKVAASDLEGIIVSSPGKNLKKRSRVPVVVLVAVPVAVLILVSLVLLFWIKRRKFRGTKVSTVKSVLSYETNRTINLTETESSLLSATYHFSSIIEATDNFSYANKLGEGGFGPVYKGRSSEGQEIAVKRLAAQSGQGLKEFENEILLIAKLQHRNLVRLLGYCIHREEKILIYEYMPNKGLDYFLFDSTRRAQLDWGRRFQIIEGISQGLLYLHKHSRLRIIHRDLKASNILLDADMNPKISDFGMARIFGSNDTEATNRIVGTYGYMSPEYASEGLFSIKSDVFSFGVLLLEIVSGRRNSSYQRMGNTLNLIGYAWELWKEAKWLDLVDPCLNEPMHEISRCIHVALLCVQESASDRPSMSAVISMLSSDSALPIPKQPAFYNVRIEPEEELTPKLSKVGSVNEVTITAINGR